MFCAADQPYFYDGIWKCDGQRRTKRATPANNYTPSKPISIALRQDTLPGKGNSISEDIPYFEPTQTTPAIYRSFTDFAGSDSSRWICTYKHSKTENGISGISPGMIFLPGSNSRQETMNIDRM